MTRAHRLAQQQPTDREIAIMNVLADEFGWGDPLYRLRVARVVIAALETTR